MSILDAQPAELVEVGFGVITFMTWLIRLEGKIKAQAEIAELKYANFELRSEKLDTDHANLRSRFERLEDKIVQKLSFIERTVSNIEGRLSYKNKNHSERIDE